MRVTSPTAHLGVHLRQGQLLVIYDGNCGLCNRSVQFLLRRDRRDNLRFAPSSDPAITDLLACHGISVIPDTILVIRNVNTPIEELLIRSNAILACLRVLPQPWPLFASIARLIPRPAREGAYRLVARYRYKIWGRYVTCPVPTPEDRSHFL